MIEVDNTGGWYDLGFLLGTICIWGGGSTAGCVRSKRRKEEASKKEWGEVCGTVEHKLRDKLRTWAESDDD